MRIKATDEQIQKMCALAVQASRPMGMGFLQFNASTIFRPEEFKIAGRSSVYIDYEEGRMVKLSLRRVTPGGDIWEAQDQIRADYESWITTYPSYAELAAAAGAEVL